MSKVTQLHMDDLGKSPSPLGFKDTPGKVRKSDSMHKVLYDYAEHSSMHGVWKVANPDYTKLRRLIWMLALMTTSTVFLYAFIQQLTMYLQYRVTTVLSVEEQATLDFPAVTLCNYNQYRKSKALEKPGVMAVLQELFSVEAIMDRQKKNLMSAQSLVSQDLNLIKELIALAHTLEGMVRHCQWCGRTIPCSDYFSQTLTEVGVCYTFNSKEVRKRVAPLEVHDAGTDCGLKLRINVQDKEYYYGEGSSAGIQMLIHDPQEVPLVRQHGFSAAPGTSVMAAIRLTKETYAQSPYGDCVDTKNPSFQNPLRHHDMYTYTACKLEHRVDYVFNACGCVMYYDPVGSRPICKTVDEVLCFKKAKENHTRYEMQAMRHACPVTCQSDTYEARLSWASFPAPQILKDLQKNFNMSTDQVRKNLLQITVYFEDLGIHKKEQQPAYTGASLFADTGGMMGLCIGASLLTLVELIELGAQLLLSAGKHR